MGEGKDARVAGASVTYAAIRYRNAARAARKRGESPLRDEVARARAGLLISAAAAWHPLWLKWRASLGETHLPESPIPPAQTRLGEVFQASKRFGFALSQGNQSHTLAGGILRAAERLRRKDYTKMPWRKTPAAEEATGPGGVIRVPPTPGIPGLRSSPGSSRGSGPDRPVTTAPNATGIQPVPRC